MPRTSTEMTAMPLAKNAWKYCNKCDTMCTTADSMKSA